MSQRYMFDTNTVSYIVKGTSKAARMALQNLEPHQIGCVSVITEAEIRYGLAKQASRALTVAVDAFLAKIQILPWGRQEAGVYGKLRAKLQATGKTLGNLDLLIAAHAIAAGAVLITSDPAFGHIEDLHGVQNWATDLRPFDSASKPLRAK